jgi:hypothetical protein
VLMHVSSAVVILSCLGIVALGPLLLVAAGRESFDAAPFRGHAAADRLAAPAGRMTGAADRADFSDEDGRRTEKCRRHRSNDGYFRVSAASRNPALDPCAVRGDRERH